LLLEISAELAKTRLKIPSDCILQPWRSFLFLFATPLHVRGTGIACNATAEGFGTRHAA